MGGAVFVPYKSLRMLTKFSTHLTEVPGQAVHVSLAGVSFTYEMAKDPCDMATTEKFLHVVDTKMSSLSKTCHWKMLYYIRV